MNSSIHAPRDEATESLRREVGGFLDGIITNDVRRMMEESGEEHSREITQAVGRAGYLGLAWPKRIGGRGRGHLAQAIVFEESSYRRAPVLGAVLSQIVGSTLAALEPQEKRTKQVIGGLRDGSLNICVGYTEPKVGSDLASLETTAVKRGDKYVINGTKAFQSVGHLSDLYYVAVRTDSTVERHEGISMMLVDAESEGISVKPVHTCGGFRLNEVHYQDVAVDASCIVGGLNKGWSVLGTSLTFGRTVPWRVGQVRRLADQIVAIYTGFPSSEEKERWRAAVTNAVSRAHAATLMVYHVLDLEEKGEIPMGPAASSKLFISELIPQLAGMAMDMLGADGYRSVNSEGAPLRGEIEWAYRQFQERRWAEGATEIQRGVIAKDGLGLPRR